MKIGEKVLFGAVVTGICAGGYFVAKKIRDFVVSETNNKTGGLNDFYKEVHNQVMSINVEDLYGDDKEEVEIKISMFDTTSNEEFNLISTVTKEDIRRIHKGMKAEKPLYFEDERDIKNEASKKSSLSYMNYMSQIKEAEAAIKREEDQYSVEEMYDDLVDDLSNKCTDDDYDDDKDGSKLLEASVEQILIAKDDNEASDKVSVAIKAKRKKPVNKEEEK